MIPKLNCTTDYSRFKLCEFNRSVKKLDNLKHSMKRHGYLAAYPIHCTKGEDGLLLVKAGHHRLTCAIALEIPVYYVVLEDTASIHELEKATVRWTTEDYLESFIRMGVADYETVREYHVATGIPIVQCVSVLGGESANSSNKMEQFKSGSFKVTPEGLEHSTDLRRIVLHLKALNIPINRTLVAALSRCLAVPEFSIDTFLSRASANPELFKRSRTVEDKMRNLEEIYNFRSQVQNKLALCFRADQVMRERSCITAAE